MDGGSAVITHVTTAGFTTARGHTIDSDAVLPCGPDSDLWFADTPASVGIALSGHGGRLHERSDPSAAFVAPVKLIGRQGARLCVVDMDAHCGTGVVVWGNRHAQP